MASTGKQIRIISEVTRMFQEKIGIRNMVRPGARIVMMVVVKFTAPRIDERPSRQQAHDPQVVADAREWIEFDRGA